MTASMFMRTILFPISCSALAIGCSAESDPAEDTQEIIDNLHEAGFPADDIRVYEGAVYVGDDAEVTLDASREMLETDGSGEEQYRTTNLVSRNHRRICIRSNFTGRFSQALNAAIDNFNNLTLTFNMFRNGTNCHATINVVRVAGPAGGSAGFPSGGRPFPRVRIQNGTEAYSHNVIEHVITHELGHAVGLRHSDWFDRSHSCGGQPVREPRTPPGAIHIPGTPSGLTTSLMNSCFSRSETGEFKSGDKTALLRLY